MPLFSPYHRFYFSQGFNVLPPPPAPYDPSSGSLMVQFTPGSLLNQSETSMDSATISVGPQTSSACFPFNLYSISLGCDSIDAPCVFNFTGLRYNERSQQETEVAWETAEVEACPEASHCKLVPAELIGFEKLTSFQVTLKVNGKPRMWWADDLALGWSDNQCEKAICRSKVRDSVSKRAETPGSRKAASRALDFALFRG
ncbi:hypothetical protein F4818DRAFT_101082 [Hypoxylon cercidicola]|nr:hypothetical protein F4818DRAFT_101082 [Hypoxylon cercidicola]